MESGWRADGAADDAAATAAAGAGRALPLPDTGSVDSDEFEDRVESLGCYRRACDRRGLVDENARTRERENART